MNALFPLRHAVVTARLPSSAKVSSTVRGLAREACEGPPEYGSVQACWCRWWVSSRGG